MSPDSDVEQKDFANFSSLLSGAMNFKPLSDVLETFTDLNQAIASFSSNGARAETTKVRLAVPTGRIAGDGWIEESSFFGDRGFGILCRPDRAPSHNCSVLFINSGTYVRSGPSRYTARLARELAIHGVASFRIDLRGTGDSPDWPQKKGSPIYNTEPLSDLSLAIDRLQSLKKTPVILIGFCSGSYLAFHLACADERVTDTVLMNLYCFDWPSDMPIEAVLDRPTVRSAATYARSLMNGHTWRRIIKRDISLLSISSSLIKAWLKVFRRRWFLSYGSSCAGSNVIDRVAKVRRRGGRMVFVYSADDPGILNIQRELGLSMRQIGRKHESTINIIDQCDHNFSVPTSQARIFSIVSDVIAQRITTVNI